jgi:hypothetical protein
VPLQVAALVFGCEASALEEPVGYRGKYTLTMRSTKVGQRPLAHFAYHLLFEGWSLYGRLPGSSRCLRPSVAGVSCNVVACVPLATSFEFFITCDLRIGATGHVP